MRINEKFKNIDHVRILAKAEAQRTKRDQRIYKHTYKGMAIYLFSPATYKKRGIELIRYTKPVKRADVLPDNGNEQSEPIKTTKKKAVKIKESKSE